MFDRETKVYKGQEEFNKFYDECSTRIADCSIRVLYF